MEERLLILWGAAVVFHFVMPIWVYSDARTSSPHTRVLWALVVFFGGFIGLLVYLVGGRGTGRRAGTHS